MTEQIKNQSDVPKDTQGTAVYIPFKTFQTAITTLAQAMPKKLDKSAWPTFNNLLKGQTYNAFKFLGLIDKDGDVQPVLRELVKEKPESSRFKSILAEILKDRYKNVIELASQNGTITQLQDTMRGYGVSGTTLERAIRFWTDAAKFVEIPYPDSWEKATGGIVRRGRKGTARGSEGDHNKPEDEKQPENVLESGYNKVMKLPGGIGNITLIVSVNPIELKGKARAWFYELVDKLDECPIDEEK
jgi:hypothetical protein